LFENIIYFSRVTLFVQISLGGRTLNVLSVGAHPDDIELGCGATLLAHKAAGDRVVMLVMTTGEQGPQDARSRVEEQEDAAALIGADLLWGGFEDGAVPEGRSAIDVIQHAARAAQADIVYTHSPRDTHQDHRATAVASLSACRRLSRVLMYESPTTTSFQPAMFVDVKGLVESKVDVLRAHVSQVLKNGLVDLEAVEAQARYRGFQARIREAEAFETDRFLWTPGAVRPDDSNALIDLKEVAV
jgi:LmbE family N-acetylglucosaminyl deacetylase